MKTPDQARIQAIVARAFGLHQAGNLRNQPCNPWYPSARIFGQPAAGDWDPVVAQVREALAHEFAGSELVR